MLATRRVRVARHLKIVDNAIVGYVLSHKASSSV